VERSRRPSCYFCPVQKWKGYYTRSSSGASAALRKKPQGKNKGHESECREGARRTEEEQKKSTQKAGTKTSKKKQDQERVQKEKEAKLLELKQRLEAIITKYECLVAQIVVKPLTESKEPYRTGVQLISPNVLLVIVDANHTEEWFREILPLIERLKTMKENASTRVAMEKERNDLEEEEEEDEEEEM